MLIATILDALVQVESGGNWRATNGDCWGGLQISSVLVEDVNRIAGTRFTHTDAFSEVEAKRMACVYLNYYVTKGKLGGREPTVRDYAGVWRHGPRGWNLIRVEIRVGDMDYVERVNNIVESKTKWEKQ